MAGLVAISAIAEKIGGLSRQRADQLTREPTFPAPVQTVGRYRLWEETDVDEWLDEHRPGWRYG